MTAKQAINHKLQGRVATYLRCDGVVNNQIKKGLLLSLCEKNKIGEYLAKLQARTWLFPCFVHFLRLSAVRWPSAQSARGYHVFASNFVREIFLIGEYLANSAINLS